MSQLDRLRKDTMIPGVWKNKVKTGSLNSDTPITLKCSVSDSQVRPENTAVRIWKRVQ